MRTRLRPCHDADTLARIYERPWSAECHPSKDHALRIAATIAVASWFDGIESVADLSCGDGAIARALGVPRTYLGDLAPGYGLHGPIEATIGCIPSVDLFICSETLEHIDDPESLLAAIRTKTRYLVASTPIGEWNPIHNPEHYWGWGVEDFGALLAGAGFEKVVYAQVDTPPPYLYDFQIWGCQ